MSTSAGYDAEYFRQNSDFRHIHFSAFESWIFKLFLRQNEPVHLHFHYIKITCNQT
jgi:hypothetical protein